MDQWYSVSFTDDSIKELRTELSDANDLLEDARKKGLAAPTEAMITEMSPSAAATSKLLKSGMTLTQVRARLVSSMSVEIKIKYSLSMS